MPALSPARRSALLCVVEACPDAVLGGLTMAVGALPGEGAVELAAMLDEEGVSRRRRAVAFAPLLPMFRPRADETPSLSFPPSVLTTLWRRVEREAPDLAAFLDTGDADAAAAADRLCARAAGMLRDDPGAVWPDGGGSNRDPRVAELAGCLDLAHLARAGVSALPAWLDRPDPEQLASLRLLIRDAEAVADAGGRRMVDILFAHAPEAGRMLRVVTRTSKLADHQGVLSQSDMGVFVERLLQAVQARVERIGEASRRLGPDNAARVTADILWCADVLAELDLALQLKPDTAWGQSARLARVGVSGAASGLLQSAASAVHAALPQHKRTIVGRMKRLAPWLDAPPDGEAMALAADLLPCIEALRPAAGVLGYEAERARVGHDLADYLSTWANEALDEINDGEAANADAALRLVGCAARFLTELKALDAARAVRRRAAAAEAALAIGDLSPGVSLPAG
ncbi:hypothetical protein [Brevundimonas sp. PAMC22021]|uniref:hypothetical protein n=1 Tax=Brevundimonas sp. PAMC22021 TaxID=2861285 RepID=UPI001C63645B|nr:hypothetical protein [Brevundimonas sp. PAMC22021]QYF86175.1 hypothetical protein KY493_09995 [Brevundimonas sp. PAMC22021]